MNVCDKEEGGGGDLLSPWRLGQKSDQVQTRVPAAFSTANPTQLGLTWRWFFSYFGLEHESAPITSYLIDPLNSTGSWRMMESRERSVCSGSLQMSIPSMTIFPANEHTHTLTSLNQSVRRYRNRSLFYWNFIQDTEDYSPSLTHRYSNLIGSFNSRCC